MSLASQAAYKAAFRERVILLKTAAASSATGTAPTFFTLWDGTGNPGAGTLAIGNTASGLTPTDGTAGAPAITFTSGNGYITDCELSAQGFTTQGLGRFLLYDRLFHAGTYSFNSAVTLASQPSYASRVPGGDYTGLQIWTETVTAFTGSYTVTVGYTNQSGTSGRSAVLAGMGALNPRVMLQFPLQAGDRGVQRIDSVTSTVATVGTFNILVARPLRWLIHRRQSTPALTERYWMDRLGMPQIYPDSCLALLNYIVQNSVTPTVELALEIASA